MWKLVVNSFLFDSSRNFLMNFILCVPSSVSHVRPQVVTVCILCVLVQTVTSQLRFAAQYPCVPADTQLHRARRSELVDICWIHTAILPHTWRTRLQSHASRHKCFKGGSYDLLISAFSFPVAATTFHIQSPPCTTAPELPIPSMCDCDTWYVNSLHARIEVTICACRNVEPWRWFI